MYMYYSSKVQTKLPEENLVSTWRPISDPVGTLEVPIACAVPSGVFFSRLCEWFGHIPQPCAPRLWESFDHNFLWSWAL